MADLTDRYVLKIHRSLPAAERPVWCYRPVSLEDLDELKEQHAEPTGAPVDGRGEGEQRRPVEQVRMGDLWIELLARNVESVSNLRQRRSPELVNLPDLPPAAKRKYFRGVPVRWVRELYQAVTGDPDPEEESSSSASGPR
jgi:hypothetical protein